jgi:hypothetical protein
MRLAGQVDAFFSSLMMIIVSELGDKTVRSASSKRLCYRWMINSFANPAAAAANEIPSICSIE